MEYNFRKIEEKWQKRWAGEKTFRAENKSLKPKYYVLDMFPYPSGAGLHVGHPLGYIASDIYSRFKRLMGFNVLHPMGYDSFGLPAEQYAIQTGQHPAKTTEENIKRYREQLDKLGFSFDWEREVRTSDPAYYKWTQWVFLQLFNSWYNITSNKAEKIDKLIAEFEKNGNQSIRACADETKVFSAADWKAMNEKEQQLVLMNYRLAYLSDAYVWWCSALGSVLANDEVKDGVSERGGYPVERRLMKQWSMRITAYADRLLQGLDAIDWTESLKEAQRNWIGRSEGTSLKFEIRNLKLGIEVFTTRPDTIFGVSFLTLAPEHELVEKITTLEQKAKVQAYLDYAKARSERERMADVKKVTGEFTGAYAVHPFTGKDIPIWVGDYVLAGYGTGAVMGVPGHDERDHRFATHFKLPILKVVEGSEVTEAANEAKEGKMINSDFINGMEVKAAIKKAIEEVEKRGLGKGKVNYRLRDAVFGRQRYWGEPIPIYYKDGIPYPVDEEDLPLELPEVDKYLPTESGEPPLARAKDWVYSPLSNSPRRGEDRNPVYQTADKHIWGILKENARENRKKSTLAEELLWNELRANKMGCKFRRQHPIDTFIADFACLDKKLVVEVDGKIHEDEEQQLKDRVRTEILLQKGFRVIRFTNEEIEKDISKVISKIKDEINSLPYGEGRGGAAYPLETTTMPGWAGSSWYYLRYMDAKNPKEFASREATDYWQNVDLYIGGTEHATGHLLYVRFWTKALKDLGFISTDEPAKKLINQGMIQGVSMIAKTTFANAEKYNKSGMIVGELETILLGKDLNVTNQKLISETHIPIDHVDFINGKHILKKDNLEKLRTPGSKFEKFRLLTQDDVKRFDIKLEDEDKTAMNEEYVELRSEVEKMSKSKYNVVNPDDMCIQYGADTFRMYEMFLGPLEQSKPWNTNGITGVHSFLKKYWRLFYNEKQEVRSLESVGFFVSEEQPTKAELKTLHKTIKKAKEDIERFSFNTSVSLFMICVNELTDLKCNKRAILEPLTILLSPYAPHIAEEIWEKLGHSESISYANYPEFKQEYTVDDTFAYPVSFNGKMKFNLELPLSLTKEDIEKEVLAAEQTHRFLDGKAPKKVIVVPNKIVNIVV